MTAAYPKPTIPGLTLWAFRDLPRVAAETAPLLRRHQARPPRTLPTPFPSAPWRSSQLRPRPNRPLPVAGPETASASSRPPPLPRRAGHPRRVPLPGAAVDRWSLVLARWFSPPLCGPSHSSRNARPRRWDVCDARRSSPFPSGGRHHRWRGRGRTSRTRCCGRRPWRPRRRRRPRRSAPRGPPRLSIAAARRWQLAPRERAIRRGASTLRRRSR